MPCDTPRLGRFARPAARHTSIAIGTREGHGRRRLAATLATASLLLCWSTAAATEGGGEPTPSAREILDRVDDLFRGDSSQGRATMTIRTAHWERSLTLEFQARGEERSLVRILAPLKEKGTATLKSGNDLWNYLPKVKRVIKLPSSMMSASWMGSHFTNDDLVKESRMADDYEVEISFDGERDGSRVLEITCTPKPEAPVVWGRLLVAVRRDDLLPLVVRYYDEDLDLARTLTYSDIRELGGRTLPARLVMVPADKPSESTSVAYEAIDFDVALSDDTFSLRELQR